MWGRGTGSQWDHKERANVQEKEANRMILLKKRRGQQQQRYQINSYVKVFMFFCIVCGVFLSAQ